MSEDFVGNRLYHLYGDNSIVSDEIGNLFVVSPWKTPYYTTAAGTKGDWLLRQYGDSIVVRNGDGVAFARFGGDWYISSLPQLTPSSSPGVGATAHTATKQFDNNKQAAWYDQKWRIVRAANPMWTDQQVYDEMTRQINEANWNANYKKLIFDIANSSSRAERENKISTHKPELDAYRKSGINVDNDLRYLRDTQWQDEADFADKTVAFLKEVQYSIGVDSASGISAEYLLSPDNRAHVVEELTEQEKAEGVTLQYNEDGTTTKVKGEMPLPGELEKIDDRDRVKRQSIADGIGNLVESWKLLKANQEKESRETMAKNMLALERVSPEDPLYEFKLREYMNLLDGLQDSVVPGGMKFVRGLNGVIKGSSKAGKLLGSLDGLTSAERTVVSDLLSKGKKVEIIAKTTESKTPDFLVNGVKTELKSLENLNLNTAITRIQKGFKQGAEVVIIDGRQAGLSIKDSEQVLTRAAGTYESKALPGRVEIWTIEGIVRR